MSLKTIAGQFDGEYAKVSKKALAEIYKVLSGSTPEELPAKVRAIFKKYGLDDKTEKIMLDIITQGAAFGVGVQAVANPAVFRKVWLNNVYDPTGIKFSTRLSDVARHDELIYTIKEALKAKESWNMAAQNLFDKHIQTGDISQGIDDLLYIARKINRLSDNSAAYQIYKTEVRKVQRSVDRLTNPSTSTLKRAYQNVVELTNSSSAAAVERASKYAVYFKEKYNAERVLHTEVSRAYGQARIVEMQSNDDVVACKSVLNSGHSVRDICDFYAESDLYGMGAGIFPKDHLPHYPYHPWCKCQLNDVFVGEVTPKTGRDFNPKGGGKYLKSLKVSEQKDLLGKEGFQKFKKDPSKWYKVLKSYQKPVTQIAKIPLSVLINE